MANIVYPNSNSSPAQWIDFHKQLKNEVGQEQANSIFMQLWAQGGQSSFTSQSGDLRAYAKGQGMTIEGNIIGFSAISDTYTSVNNGAAKIGNATTIGIVLVCVMLVAATYFLFLKD